MKILIMGDYKIGKSTLGDKISEIFGINVFNINDALYNNYAKRELEEQVRLLNKINIENKEWIIEGVISSELYFLLNLATDVIMVDFDNDRSLFRKIFQGNLDSSLDFKTEKKNLYKRLGYYSSNLIILKSRKDIKRLLEAYNESVKY